MKKMLWCFVVVMMSSSAYAECTIKGEMSDDQWGNILKSYDAAKPHGYGITLAAIVIEESQAGLYRINSDSRDYGLTQISIKTAVVRLGYRNTPMMRNITALALVENDDLAIRLAIEELLYWDGRHNGNWKYVVASYNKGNNVDRGLEVYYPKIAPLVNRLKPCFKEEVVADAQS